MRDPYTTGNGSSEWIEARQKTSWPSPDPTGHDFVARQAIFNQIGHVYGYELLFRLGLKNHFAGHSGTATRTIVGNAALHGFEGLSSHFPTFVNCTREALVEGWVGLLPSATVLELVETVLPDDEVVRACRTLKRAGYRIALDDFLFSMEMERLVELADYVKIDFRVPVALRRNTLRELSGTRAKLVAEKVETEEELRTAFDEGFELFQGFYLEHPRIFFRRNGIDPRHSALLRAMTAFWPEPYKQDETEVPYFLPVNA